MILYTYHTVWWKITPPLSPPRSPHTHSYTHIYVHMDIHLLTLFFASIKAPASSSNLTTSEWPLEAALIRGVWPDCWNILIEEKDDIRYDYQ